MARKKLYDGTATTKALGLGALLVVGIFILGKMDHLLAFADKVFADTPQTVAATETLFDKEQWLAKQKELAGFWFYESPTLSDRIELKDNGIIWRYSTYRHQFPFGKKDSLSRVSTAYLQPFSKDTTTGLLNHNVRVIRETWLAQTIGDTCYGNVMYDNLWHTPPAPENNKLVLNGLTYHRYTGDIAYFFPKNSLALVDDITVVGCNVENYHITWLHNTIAQAFDGETMDFQMLSTIHYDMVKKYYAPLCLSAIPTAIADGETFDVDMEIFLNGGGTVDSVHLSSEALPSKYARANMINEISEWRFPADGTTPLTIKYKGIIRRRSLGY